MFSYLISKVYAAGYSGAVSPATFDNLFAKVKEQILDPIIYLLIGLAVLYFLYGVYEFVKNAESPEKRSEGGQHILWGLIGLFIMLSVKGIINLVLTTMAG